MTPEQRTLIRDWFKASWMGKSAADALTALLAAPDSDQATAWGISRGLGAWACR